MSEKNKEKMTMEEALRLIIVTAEDVANMLKYSGLVGAHDYVKQATEMARNGEAPVEVSQKMKRIKCQHCGFIQNDSWTYCKSCRKLMYGIYGKPHKVMTLKKHSEFQRIKIETIKTAPVEEEITDEVDK